MRESHDPRSMSGSVTDVAKDLNTAIGAHPPSLSAPIISDSAEQQGGRKKRGRRSSGRGSHVGTTTTVNCHDGAVDEIGTTADNRQPVPDGRACQICGAKDTDIDCVLKLETWPWGARGNEMKQKLNRDISTRT